MTSRPTTRVKVQARSRVKVATIPKFPAQVIAGDGIAIENSGGVFTFSVDPGFVPSFDAATPFTAGDILYASDTNSVDALTAVATGNVLLSGGAATAPAWGKVGLTTHVSGVLPAANGGTGVANAFTTTLGGALTTAGSFTTAGAFSLLLTTTAATALTLPTSGTLATRSFLNAKDYAQGNVVSYTLTASITSGLAVLTVVGGLFTAADIGKRIFVPGAGVAGAGLWTTILGFTSNNIVTLAANASTTLSAVSTAIEYGTDDTAALATARTAAATFGLHIYFPKGEYYSSTTQTIPSFGGIYGDGPSASIISCITSNVPVVTFAGDRHVGCSLKNIQVKRAPNARNATAGGDGVDARWLHSDDLISNVHSYYNYIGFNLGPTSHSDLLNCRAFHGTADALYLSDSLGADPVHTGPLQWNVYNFWGIENDGSCYNAEALFANSNLGAINGIKSFLNGGYGFRIAAAPGLILSNVNGRDLFLGNDLDGEIFISARYPGAVLLSGVSMENAGTDGDGTTVLNAAAIGITIDDTNGRVYFNNLSVIGCQSHGLYTTTDTYIENAELRGNGDTSGSGIVIDSATATFDGVNIRSMGHTGFGLFGQNGTNVHLANFKGGSNGGGDLSFSSNSISGRNATRDPVGTGTLTAISTSANALSVGRQGATDPILQVDASTASVATGVKIKGAAAAGGAAISVISTGANESLTIDAKGSGTITFGGTSTGLVAISRNTTIAGMQTNTSVSASALTVGRQGATNPALQVDASAASSVTGIKVTAAAAAGGVALAAISSGSNENLAIDAKGGGSVTINGTGTGPAILRGTATNDNAAAGFVGEYSSSTITDGSGVGLTSTVPANVTSLSLSAGDWDVSFEAHFNGAGTTTVTNIIASVSTNSATLNTTPGNFGALGFAAETVYNNISGTLGLSLPVGPVRVSLSGTTTVYGVAQSLFGVSTSKAFGTLRARRVR
jgi:hypothetical protein